MENGAAKDNLEKNDAVEVFNFDGAGDFVFVCEHASNVIPADLQNLGLPANDLDSHIAWDLGAFEVAWALSSALDSPLIASNISRLVYDCNRPPGVPSAVVTHSDDILIPGNQGLDERDMEKRKERAYQPFYEALHGCLETRRAQGQACVLVTIHSFTPVYQGVVRDFELGVLHDEDARFADEILSRAKGDDLLQARRNEPYGPLDGVTHTLVEHGLAGGLLNVMLEIRNDMIVDASRRAAVTAKLEHWLVGACAVFRDEMTLNKGTGETGMKRGAG